MLYPTVEPSASMTNWYWPTWPWLDSCIGSSWQSFETARL